MLKVNLNCKSLKKKGVIEFYKEKLKLFNINVNLIFYGTNLKKLIILFIILWYKLKKNLNLR